MTSHPWRHQVPLPHQLLSDQLEQNDENVADEADKADARVDVDAPQIQVAEGRVAQSLCGPWSEPSSFGVDKCKSSLRNTCFLSAQLPIQTPKQAKDPCPYGPYGP